MCVFGWAAFAGRSRIAGCSSFKSAQEPRHGITGDGSESEPRDWLPTSRDKRAGLRQQSSLWECETSHNTLVSACFKFVRVLNCSRFKLSEFLTIQVLDQGSPTSRGTRAAQSTTRSLASRTGAPLAKKKQQTQHYENSGWFPLCY